jgi:hypothetical protein
MCPASPRHRSNLGGLNPGRAPAEVAELAEEGDEEVRAGLYERFNEAVSDLEKRKFKFDLTPPTEDLVSLPSDLAGMSSKTWSDHYQATLKHWDFLASVAADVEARLVTLKSRLKEIEAELEEAKKTGPQIILNKERRACNNEIDKLKTQSILLEPKKSFLHRRMAMLSRSVSGAELDARLGGRGEHLNQPHRRGTPGGYRTDL